jgi:hypothetical protein
MYLSGGGARCSGGDGLSPEAPIVVTAGSSMEGVEAEYRYVEQHYGVQDVDWTLAFQALEAGSGGAKLDVLGIALEDGRKFSLYFDITSFYGKF